VGYQVIDGTRLDELRATDLGHPPSLGSLPDVWPGAHVTSLEVWVDGHGVVHRMSLGFEVIQKVVSLAPWRLRQAMRDGKLVKIITVRSKRAERELRAGLAKARVRFPVTVRVAAHLPGTVHREVQATALTVTFSGIGQPQHITAPRHAIQQYGHG
jgi:hypothetical protein